jgi:hypothetical protein
VAPDGLERMGVPDSRRRHSLLGLSAGTPRLIPYDEPLNPLWPDTSVQPEVLKATPNMFGKISAMSVNSRIMQFGLKLEF